MYRIRPTSYYNHPIGRNNNITKRRHEINNIRKRKTLNTISQKISIIGVNKIIDSNNHWSRRVIWFVILMSMTCFCCYQLSKDITRYLSKPVIKQTDVVRSDYVHFPAIQVCPGFARDLQHVFLLENNEVCADNTAKCWVTDPFQQQIFGLIPPFSSEIPLARVMNVSMDTKIYKMCDGNELCEINGMEWHGNSTPVQTASGLCMVFDTSESVPFRGPFTYMKLEFDTKLHKMILNKLRDMRNNSTNETEKEIITQSLDQLRTGMIISLHNSFETNRKHLFYFEAQDIYLGFETHLQLHERMFTTLNSSKNRCDTEDKVVQCVNDCIEKNLSSICSPLYYNVPSKDICEWSYDFMKLEMENYKAYNQLNLSDCRCPNICEEITYTVYHNVIMELQEESKMILKIFFLNGYVEKITEKYSYEFTACLSDVGGHLGFFLGFCTLTILEMMEFGLVRLLSDKKKSI